MRVFAGDGPPYEPDGRALVGHTVRLDQASNHDGEGLFKALNHDEVWASGYNSGRRPKSAGAWRQMIDTALRDDRVMYVVRQIEPGHAQEPGPILGTTSLGDLDLDNEKVHLGWTAYDPSVWGTSVNPECKLLLLWHAFEHCKLGRVKLRTDSINVRSQAAIAKIGATREGVARRHIKRADGSWRDSVIYSVISDDWPVVKSGLEQRIAAFAAQ